MVAKIFMIFLIFMIFQRYFVKVIARINYLMLNTRRNVTLLQ